MSRRSPRPRGGDDAGRAAPGYLHYLQSLVTSLLPDGGPAWQALGLAKTSYYREVAKDGKTGASVSAARTWYDAVRVRVAEHVAPPTIALRDGPDYEWIELGRRFRQLDPAGFDGTLTELRRFIQSTDAAASAKSVLRNLTSRIAQKRREPVK